MATIKVQPEPFDPGAEIAALLHNRTDIGGLGCFLGTVRGTTHGSPHGSPPGSHHGTLRPIAALVLEHYPGMTERALAAIAAQAEARWPLQGCTIIHRTGRLTPGEPIVLVATTSAHRQAALDSTAFLIDWLKTKAPFWKQEEFATGETTWVEARHADDQATLRWEQTNPTPARPASTAK